MWRSSPRAVRSGLAATLACVLVVGCKLISTETLEVKTWPSERETIIEASAKPWVEFPDAPDRAAAQRLLSITFADGQVSGDFSWDGDRMYFSAQPAFKPGVRYVLGYHGVVVLDDGRTFQSDVDVPFFSRHGPLGAFFAYCTPADGSISDTTTPLVLHFVQPIDANSFRREFSLQPSDETRIAWSASETIATISPESSWQNMTTYAWSISKDLASTDGTPSGIAVSGHFRTQADAVAPAVAGLQPAQRDTFAPTGLPLSGLKAYDAILIIFSKDVKTDSLASAFSLNPAVKGAILRIASGLFAYSTQERFLMNQRYVLRIGSSVEDLAGNKMAQPYVVEFTPDVLLQTIASIDVAGGATIAGAQLESHPEIGATVATDGTLSLTIAFSQPFSTAQAKAKMPIAISFEGYFPASVADPSLINAFWATDARLSLGYAGLVKSDASARRYYKLLIPGGSGSQDNGEGSCLEKDAWLILRAQ